MCWDWVWQRPQQFLSRLSERHQVLFVETLAPDPQLVAPIARFETLPAHPNITRLRMQFPTWRWNNGAYVDKLRRKLLQEALLGPLAGKFENPVQWFYDPMAVTPFAGHMDEIATVYDCMDELSKFRHADPELINREMQLLAKADVVFTGGSRLYDAKSKHNDNCHFYGCGVDSEHFGKARDPRTALPPELRNKGDKKMLGYFGVVDERMDYELIARLADANPNWEIVIVGPLAKVEECVLPRRSNIQWLGGRPYSELPAYCKAFDVCLMPFALNEATEYINPTKALEYMATGTEIISSAVPDVVRNFASVVKIANSHDGFVSLCQRAVAEPDRAAIERGIKMAANHSWDSIVAQMEGHIEDVLANKLNVASV
ncbi:glycosyltransferase [Pedosphaera parvula]|uniref:glycosyltransferase n=1 Tax=Pedosphaera parvula TaxID=1032527 RepID=UPI00135F1529|nr:glycosyltransferase [Pedosphaera parvula]